MEAIINTHGHADHVMGDAAFGFPVLIHEADAACLNDPVRSLSFLSGQKMDTPEVKKYVADGDIIKMGDIDLEILHTPGHTPGGISIKCGDVLFSGDTLFFESVGRTDLPGGDHRALISGIKEKLMTLPDDVTVYPGHGPETTIGHERKYNEFLQ